MLSHRQSVLVRKSVFHHEDRFRSPISGVDILWIIRRRVYVLTRHRVQQEGVELRARVELFSRILTLENPTEYPFKMGSVGLNIIKYVEVASRKYAVRVINHPRGVHPSALEMQPLGDEARKKLHNTSRDHGKN